MDFRSFLDTLSYKGVGILLWTEDRDGNIRVLLSRRRLPSLLGDAYSVGIASGDKGSNETDEDAALRVAHDELGINIDRRSLQLFYREKEGGVSLTLFSCHLNSMVKPKDGRGYTDSLWYVLPDDSLIADADNLTVSELKEFRASLKIQKIS